MEYITQKQVNDFFELLKMNNISYVLIKNIGDELPDCLPVGKDIDIIVNESDKNKFMEIMKNHDFHLCNHPVGSYNGYAFLYGLPEFWQFSDAEEKLYIDTTFKLCCKGLMPKTWIPLDKKIQERIWKERVWDEKNNWWIMDSETRFVYYIARCIFDLKKFSETYTKEIENTVVNVRWETVEELLSFIFYRYTKRLVVLIKNKQYHEIISDYIAFSEY